MTTSTSLLTDAYERIHEEVHAAVDGLSEVELSSRIRPDANSIAWLIWHLTRVQDDHISEVAGKEQVWTSAGWLEKFGLPFDKDATGYGQSSDEVGAVKGIDASLLIGYFDAVHAQTLAFLEGVTESDLVKIVDDRWDPPVTLSARLVSILSDDLQHAGQAAFIRGLL